MPGKVTKDHQFDPLLAWVSGALSINPLTKRGQLRVTRKLRLKRTAKREKQNNAVRSSHFHRVR